MKRNFFNYFNYALTGTEHGGPFNRVARKPPSGRRDRNFWKHDKAYGRLGKRAYTHWNKSDSRLLRKLSWSRPSDFLAKSYFSLKKRVAPRYVTKAKSFRGIRRR